jgi:glucokinase
MPDYTIGLDLGGTNLRAAAISTSGQVLASVSGRAELSTGRDAVIKDMVNAIVKLRDQIGSGLAGIGMGVPGFIIIEKGIIVGSPNLPAFDGYALRDDMEKQLGTTVVLENDANVAALGEKWMGVGKAVDDMVLLTLGTGIGGGIISNGRVLHGHVGMAGELGHMTVVPNGNPCGCGNRGCLEKHASATAISGMAKIIGLGADLTSEQVFKLAVAGDEKAKRIFEAMGQALGVALATLVNIFNFPLYVLSGGPLPAWDYFAPAMLQEARWRSFTFRNTDTKVEKAILGGEAGLYGAAYLPILEKKK